MKGKRLTGKALRFSGTGTTSVKQFGTISFNFEHHSAVLELGDESVFTLESHKMKAK